MKQRSATDEAQAPCQRWHSLSDGAALGDATGGEERAFFADHAAQCRACGCEAQLWAGLELVLRHPAVLTNPFRPFAGGAGASPAELVAATAPGKHWPLGYRRVAAAIGMIALGAVVAVAVIN